MSHEHYLPHQYNIDNIIYGNIEILDSINNKLIVQIYDEKKGKPLYIQTPELHNLFGIIKKKSYSELLLPLGGIQCLAFKNLLNKLQNKVLNDANLNKNSWFKNQKSVKFIPLIKELNKDVSSTVEELSDLDNLSKCDEGLLKIKVTDSTIIKKENSEISIDELSKNKKIRMILHIYAIWVNQNTFGIYVKPEIIEEKLSYNLSFIEENLIFESDNEESDIDSDIETTEDSELNNLNNNILFKDHDIEVHNIEQNTEKKKRKERTKKLSSSSKSNK